MPSYTEEQRRKAIEAVEECGGVGHARHTKAGVPLAPHAVRMAEPARRLAREEMRQAVEPPRPRPQGSGRGVREVGHGRQGRRRDAGGVERRRCLQLGQGRGEAGPGGGGQEPDHADEGFRGKGLRRIRRKPRGARAPARARERHPEGGGEGFKSREPRPDDEQGEDPGHKRAAGDDGQEIERAHRFLEDIEELL